MLNSSVPGEVTVIKSHVLFNSPESKHPLFPGAALGFELGLVVVPD